jgi:hypothetical protein
VIPSDLVSVREVPGVVDARVGRHEAAAVVVRGRPRRRRRRLQELARVAPSGIKARVHASRASAAAGHDPAAGANVDTGASGATATGIATGAASQAAAGHGPRTDLIDRLA